MSKAHYQLAGTGHLGSCSLPMLTFATAVTQMSEGQTWWTKLFLQLRIQCQFSSRLVDSVFEKDREAEEQDRILVQQGLAEPRVGAWSPSVVLVQNTGAEDCVLIIVG